MTKPLPAAIFDVRDVLLSSKALLAALATHELVTFYLLSFGHILELTIYNVDKWAYAGKQHVEYYVVSDLATRHEDAFRRRVPLRLLQEL